VYERSNKTEMRGETNDNTDAMRVLNLRGKRDERQHRRSARCQSVSEQSCQQTVRGEEGIAVSMRRLSRTVCTALQGEGWASYFPSWWQYPAPENSDPCSDRVTDQPRSRQDTSRGAPSSPPPPRACQILLAASSNACLTLVSIFKWHRKNDEASNSCETHCPPRHRQAFFTLVC